MAVFHIIVPSLLATSQFNEVYQMTSNIVNNDGTRTYFNPAHNNIINSSVIPGWPASWSHGIIQFWFKSSDVTTIEILRIQELGSSVSHARLQLDSTGHLQVTRNTTVLATATPSLSTNTWYYIQWEWSINNTTGIHLVKVDTVEHINITGQDTQNAGTGIVDTILWQNSQVPFYADMILADNSGGSFNSLTVEIPSVRVLSPNGAGNSAQFTPSTGANYQTVDEVPLVDTDYNASNTNTHKDTFALQNNSGDIDEVLCVIPFAVGENDDATARQLNVISRHSSSESAGSDRSLLQNQMRMVQGFNYVNPSTSLAWTPTEIDAMEAGYELSI